MSYEQDREQCLDKLVWATQKLGMTVDPEQLSQIADLIVQTMTGRWRYFHTPEHIFMVGGDDDPIEVLAALFHDVVYVQVDQFVNFNLSYYIAPYVREVQGQLFIRNAKELPNDRIFDLVIEIFNMTPGQALSPMTGQNELLSALVAAKVFEHSLPLAIVVQIVTIIEATIPFRFKTEDGLSAVDLLFDRLISVNQRFEVGMSESELRETILRSVRLSNRDVGGFSIPSAAQFLDNTWNLLPETNHNLHNSSSYTVSQYRQALQKMEGFMNFLTPERIFHRFEGEPDEETFNNLVKGARNNLEVAKLYLRSKLVPIAILEALSLKFGRDVSLTTMMGELPSSGISCAYLVDFLPDVPDAHPLRNELEQEVFDLLEKGRYKGADYDLNNSPLTTFLVKYSGFDEVERLYVRAKEFFKGELSGNEFLSECHPEVIQIVTQGVLNLFDSRKDALSVTLAEIVS